MFYVLDYNAYFFFIILGCHHKPTLLNGENEIYDKREEEITMIIDDCDYQEGTDLPANFDKFR